jgi:hypothetical protein
MMSAQIGSALPPATLSVESVPLFAHTALPVANPLDSG